MEYRQLGRSGLKVPVLSFGTGTFGAVRNTIGGSRTIEMSLHFVY